MSVNTWSHRLVRPVVRRLARTSITPNQLTWAHAAVGGLACLCFAWGSRDALIAGGAIWILAMLLDRADGDLARLTRRTSAAGHDLDFKVDTGMNVAMFLGLGVGLRHGALGEWAIALGVLCAVCLFLCLYWSEEIEEWLEPGQIVMGGAAGFDPDDLFYIVGLCASAGLLDYVLTAGSVVLPLVTVAIGTRRWRAIRRARRLERAEVEPAAAGQTRKVQVRPGSRSMSGGKSRRLSAKYRAR
jgi:archaetidylinositol phosphate synthase